METLFFGCALFAAAGAVAVKAIANSFKLGKLRKQKAASGVSADSEDLEKEIDKIVNKTNLKAPISGL